MLASSSCGADTDAEAGAEADADAEANADVGADAGRSGWDVTSVTETVSKTTH
ncbi:hypothetical protein ABBQ32_007488 [Trebouxia sp. C0010 RCD-2024]